MSKVKIKVASGGVIEKPIVTCFQGTNGNYLVLDNEANGSMGYPIICISKFDGTKLIKIVDNNEWAGVKGDLKTIISGSALPYLNVPEEVAAADDFFTQLTLPVASFDLLKGAYAPVKKEEVAPAPVEAAPAVPTVEVAPTEPVMPETQVMEEPAAIGAAPVVEPAAPVAEVAPVVEATPVEPAPVVDIPVVNAEASAPAAPAPAPAAPAEPVVNMTIPELPPVPGVADVPAAPVEAAPITNEVVANETGANVAPVEPIAPVAPAAEVAPVEPVQDVPMVAEPVEAAPVVETTEEIAPVIAANNLVDDPLAMMIPDPNITEAPVAPTENDDPITMPTQEMVNSTFVGESDDIAAIKENFMKSCETMFDALIKKFENKN